MAKARVEIIYKGCPAMRRGDNEIIVINKPSGVSVTGDRSGAAELVDLPVKQLGTETASQLRLAHRLDKGACGATILVHNAEPNPSSPATFRENWSRRPAWRS